MHTSSVPKTSPQSTPKVTKRTQNDHQNEPQMVLFGTHGTHCSPTRNRVNKVAPKWCPRRPQRDPFGSTNRALGAQKTSNIAKSMTLERILWNITKEYRNQASQFLKNDGFVKTKHVFSKKCPVEKKTIIWPTNAPKMDPSWTREAIWRHKKCFEKHFGNDNKKKHPKRNLQRPLSL